MIISRRHGYIFLHCRKTAGSSIAVALSRDLGPDDLQLSGLRESVAAGIALPDRVLREAGDTARQLEKNRLRMRLQLRGLFGQQRRMQAATRLIRRRYRPALGHHCQHAPAKAVAAAFPDDWRHCAKFCVVRNPWDKVVSDYYWRTRDAEPKPDFATFVRAMRDGDPLGGIVPVGVIDNWPMYTIDDKIVADEVIRFETLETGLPAAMNRLGIPFDGQLPRAKGGHRPAATRTDKAALYTPELRDIVHRIFEREIETFGYSFGDLEGQRNKPAAAS